jgi:hypothetical protein
MSYRVDTQLSLWHTWAHKKEILIFYLMLVGMSLCALSYGCSSSKDDPVADATEDDASENSDWQSTLESRFDIEETFDQLED